MANATWAIWFAIPRNELSGTTVSTAREWLQNNPTIFVCKLSQPVHYPIPSRPLLTFSGTNNIWANSGTTTVKYWKHITGTEAYQHVSAETIISDDDYAIVTDDGFVIGNENDYIVY